MSVVQILRDNFVASLHNRGIHYGWAMTFLAFLYALFASAAMEFGHVGQPRYDAPRTSL